MRRLIDFLVIIHTVLGQPNVELGGNEASGESIDSPKDIAEQEFNSCKSSYNVGSPGGGNARNGWFACWSLFVKWKAIDGDYSLLGPLHSKRIREGGIGSEPCLTQRATKMCKRLCGAELWKLSQDTLNSATNSRINMTWRDHPWVVACKRNHLMFRCGPSGISCWSGPGLATIMITETGQSRDFENGKGVTLPLCKYPGNLTMDVISELPLEGEELPDKINEIIKDYKDPSTFFERGFREGESRERSQTEWNKLKSDRRVWFLKNFGYPSLVNLKAEGDLIPMSDKLPLNIGKWSTWNGSKILIQNKGLKFDPKVLKLQGDIKLLKLELRFVRDILQPKKTQDLNVNWAKFAYRLANAKMGETPSYPESGLETSFQDVVERSASLVRLVPRGTVPFELWPYFLQIATDDLVELGAKSYTKFAIEDAEDYLRTSICNKIPQVAKRMEQSDWVDKINNPTTRDNLVKNFGDFMKLNLGSSTLSQEEVTTDTSSLDQLGSVTEIINTNSSDQKAEGQMVPKNDTSLSNLDGILEVNETVEETSGMSNQSSDNHVEELDQGSGPGPVEVSDESSTTSVGQESESGSGSMEVSGEPSTPPGEPTTEVGTMDAVTGSDITTLSSIPSTHTPAPPTKIKMDVVTPSPSHKTSKHPSGDVLQPEEIPKVKERVNRSTSNVNRGGDDSSDGSGDTSGALNGGNDANGAQKAPNRGIKLQPGGFSANINQRIETWIDKAQKVSRVAIGKVKPYDGISTNLKTLWTEVVDEDQLWMKLSKEASQFQVTVNQVPSETIYWEEIREILVFNQNAIIEITAPFSPLLDTIDDLAFHVDVVQGQAEEKFDTSNRLSEDNGGWFWSSLKSPRDHSQFKDGSQDQLVKKAEAFRLFEQAGIDHSLETNTNIAKHCQQRAYLEVHRQGFRAIPNSTSIPQKTQEKGVRTKKSVASAVIAAVAGLGGALIGLAGSRPHLGVEVKGLQEAVFNLHRRTSAMIRAESILKLKVSNIDQGVAAVRRGILSASATTAICEGSRTIRSTLSKIDNDEVPLELFKDRDEMVGILQEVENNLLEPNGLELVVNSTQFPDQLLSWRGRGHLSVVPRKTVLVEGNPDPVEMKGDLGYPWTHDSLDLSQSTLDISDVGLDVKYKEDLLDHMFKMNAKHKIHKAGKRSDYLENVWNLRINIEVPTKEMGETRRFSQVRPIEQLFTIGGRIVHLNVKEIVVIDQENNTGYIRERDFKECQTLKSQSLVVCPNRIIQLKKGCSSELLNGILNQECLKYMKFWPVNQPYIRSPRNNLDFVVYVPPNQSLHLKCGREATWTRRGTLGLSSLRAQPTCKIKIGTLIRTVLPKMVVNKDLGANYGTALKIRDAILQAPFVRQIGVDNLIREIHNNTNEAQTLHDIFEDLRIKHRRSTFAKFKDFCNEMVYLLAILTMSATLGWLLYALGQIWWNLKTKRLIRAKKIEEEIGPLLRSKNDPKDIEVGKVVKPDDRSDIENSTSPGSGIQLNDGELIRYLGGGIIQLTESVSGRRFVIKMDEITGYGTAYPIRRMNIGSLVNRDLRDIEAPSNSSNSYY